MTTLQQPWPEGYSINKRSPYGWRIHPITGKRTFHHGVDVAGSFPVHAPADGIIERVGWSPRGGGHTVIIKHASDLFTVYYHGAHATEWRPGQRIKLGEFIYQSGNTGASTGAHLHWEVRESARWGDTVDPVPYLSGSAAVTEPRPLPISGRLDAATWRAWQERLKTAGLYDGIVDGKPGPRTYLAIQRWANAPFTGKLDTATKIAVQRRLGVTADGQWGRLTISALQRKLNEGNLS